MTNKKDGKSNIAEWATFITACAAVGTAFGFPILFPDLVKHYFIAPSSQSSSLGQDQTAPPSAQVSSPPPSLGDASVDAGTSPVDVVLSLRQGMDYAEARNKLLSSGWMPVEYEFSGAESVDNVVMDPQTTMPPGEAFSEIFCQGTGLGLCFGKFQLEDSRSLQVTVTGQLSDHYSLLFLDSDFYIEPPETTLGVVDQLKPGLQYRKVERLLISEGWQTRVSNPMRELDELPENSQGFLKEFSHFEDCSWDDYGDIYECRFVLFAAGGTGGRRLTIVTDVEGDRDYYEPTLKSWTLE